jgi:hypothetical protein
MGSDPLKDMRAPEPPASVDLERRELFPLCHASDDLWMHAQEGRRILARENIRQGSGGERCGGRLVGGLDGIGKVAESAGGVREIHEESLLSFAGRAAENPSRSKQCLMG